jgi:hypothetical protein
VRTNIPSAAAPAGAAGAHPGGGGTGPGGVGGDWGGSQPICQALTRYGYANGLRLVSAKRDRRTTASGGVSDHWTGNTIGYAEDISNGARPTPEMDRTAVQIMAALGEAYDPGSPLVFTTRRNGFRIQVLYRTQVGGNHDDHIHVGVRRT